jgi:uncharacterized protein YrzB (UPF0473 family)
MEDKQLIITDEKGNEQLCEIIFTMDIEDRSYVIFTVPDSDEVSAAEYIPNPSKEGEGTFKNIEDDYVWEQLEDALESYQQELDEEDDEDDDDTEN